MAASSPQLFDRPDVRDQFLDHYDTLRGRVREEIVRRHLSEIVLDVTKRPLRVVDIGCGDGRDAVWLAEQGHDVLALDPAESMVEAAHEAVATAGVGERVEVLTGDAGTAREHAGEEGFDLVLSHGVIMYQPDPAAFVSDHVDLVAEGGILSLLAKNAEALVYRAVAQASVDEAMRVLDESRAVGNLGVVTDAQSIQQLSDFGLAAGATVRSWAGVRIFTDVPATEAADDTQLIDLEWKACRREPYRHSGALVHALLLKGLDLSLLPG
jgi:2-polyprenyl-3-methyl-5-hydroxy-6-metoxy-1,4-benzoquinol methylase